MRYKELEIILSNFKCNKHCPYCTAKSTQWPSVEDDLDKLELYVEKLKELKYEFNFLTIGGNGEPSLYPYEKLEKIVKMFYSYDIPTKRILTSGYIFNCPEKVKLFNDNGWVFEVTTTHPDFKVDSSTLGYISNYWNTEEFKRSNIRLNYVLLNNRKDFIIQDINSLLEMYPNVSTVALKLLNINTRTNEIDNPIAEWINNNAVKKSERDYIKLLLDSEYIYSESEFDTFTWKTKDNRNVYFSWKKEEYGLHDLVYYGDRFVNYDLSDNIPDKLRTIGGDLC